MGTCRWKHWQNFRLSSRCNQIMLCTSEPLISLPWRWFGGDSRRLKSRFRKRGEIHLAQANQRWRADVFGYRNNQNHVSKQTTLPSVYSWTDTCTCFYIYIYIADDFIYSERLLYFIIYTGWSFRIYIPNFNFTRCIVAIPVKWLLNFNKIKLRSDKII